MTRILQLVSMLYLILTFANSAEAAPGLAEIDLEIGIVKTGYNYFQRPNNETGTRVDLTPNDAQAYGRFQAFYHFNDKHTLRLLIAPLTADYQQTAKVATRYNDTTFAAGSNLNIRYQFNSYRLGYVYTIFASKDHSMTIGFTGKIRDAMIKVRDNNASAQYTNVGFVPLFYAAAETRINTKTVLGVQADGAAAPQGGAIDLGLYAGIHTDFGLLLKLGGRFLEGGSKSDKIQGFAQFWYGFAALSFEV